LRVAHVDVLDPASRPLMERLGFLATPTFILFDAQGRELWRSVGAIDPLEVDRSLAAP
jgi:thioredoxin-related protein